MFCMYVTAVAFSTLQSRLTYGVHIRKRREAPLSFTMPGWDGDMVRGFGTILSPLRICEGLKMRLSEDNRNPPSLTGINETETDSAGSDTICP